MIRQNFIEMKSFNTFFTKDSREKITSAQNCIDAVLICKKIHAFLFYVNFYWLIRHKWRIKSSIKRDKASGIFEKSEKRENEREREWERVNK